MDDQQEPSTILRGTLIRTWKTSDASIAHDANTFIVTKIRRTCRLANVLARASASAATKAHTLRTNLNRMAGVEASLLNPGWVALQDDRLGTATPPTLRFHRWPIGECVLVDFNLPATPMTNFEHYPYLLPWRTYLTVSTGNDPSHFPSMVDLALARITR
jgi:hypothetical protein